MTRLVVTAALLLTLAPSSSQERPAGQEVEPYLPVTIQVVPRLEGIRFLLDGRTLTTDHNGLAFTRLRRPGSHNLAAPDLQRIEPGVRVHFAHWADGDFPSVRKLSVTTFTTLEAGFDVSYSTPVNFVSRAGDPIAAEEIDSVTIIDDRDTGYSLASDGPQWLPGSRALASGGEIRSEEISYTLEAVVAGGRDRLTPGQPRFHPSPGQSWNIVLNSSPTYGPAEGAGVEPAGARDPRATNHVVFEVSDALFGFPTGSAVSIESPDGRSQRHELGPSARFSLEEAGAGDFQATSARSRHILRSTIRSLPSRASEAERDHLFGHCHRAADAGLGGRGRDGARPAHWFSKTAAGLAHRKGPALVLGHPGSGLGGAGHGHRTGCW